VKQELHIRRSYVKLDHDSKQHIAKKVESKSSEIVCLRVQIKFIVVVVFFVVVAVVAVTGPHRYDWIVFLRNCLSVA